MKIGVLTFHGSINPGAFWQAYATCQLIRRLGHDVEIIDYLHCHRHKRGFPVSLKKLRAWTRPDLLLRMFVLSHYADKSRRTLPLSRPILTRDELSRTHYDAVIIGSDVVWEQPIDPVFLGEGISTDRLIAYGASAGGSQAGDSPLPSMMERRCPFYRISVRDANTLDFLKRGDPSWSEAATLVSDPTITLEIPELRRKRPQKKPYLMVYNSRPLPEDFASEIQRYADSNSLDVVSVFYKQRHFKNVIRISAYDWMSYLINASAVVTNTFHGSVLACLHDRPLAVAWIPLKTRMKSIDQFRLLNIESRIVDDPAKLEETLLASWKDDAETCRRRLSGQNIDFLKNALA